MFSNFNISDRLNKAVEVSRGAIGNIQSTLKDPSVLARAGLSPSTSTANLNPSGLGEPLLIGDEIRASFEGPGSDAGIDTPRASLDGTESGGGGEGRQEGRVALSAMSPEEVIQMDAGDLQERLSRLKRFELRFSELAKAYKALQRKNQQIELVINMNTPIKQITTTGDLENLSRYLVDLKQHEEASSSEMQRLSKQVSETKQVQQMEAAAKAELLNSLQMSLIEREDEVYRLKATVQRLESQPQTPSAPSASETRSAPDLLTGDEPPPSGGGQDVTVLRTKLRDLADRLKKTIEQRNKAVERVKELQEVNNTLTSQLAAGGGAG
ncbi:hypothetical protein HK097_010296, partial [Rhizophlyctis rosea]